LEGEEGDTGPSLLFATSTGRGSISSDATPSLLFATSTGGGSIFSEPPCDDGSPADVISGVVVSASFLDCGGFFFADLVKGFLLYFLADSGLSFGAGGLYGFDQLDLIAAGLLG